jgi:ATP-dependent exoDNAse (exonuclease V) alpha subunit
VGESLRMRGRWTSHPKYGKQFEVFSYRTVLPATVQGIQRYLGSGLIKGIGAVMAERMVKHFGADIMRIIEDSPERLSRVRARCIRHSFGAAMSGNTRCSSLAQVAPRELPTWLHRDTDD